MIIYRIFNDNYNYIGSTKNLYKRMSVNKTKDKKNKKRTCSSKMIIQSGEYDVEILEECDDNKRKEREQYWIDKFECVNKINATRVKNWNRDNKERIKNYKQHWKKYQDSWGGDKRNNNNLLEIEPTIFL